MPNRPDTDAPTSPQSSPQSFIRLALTARLHETLAQDLAVLGYRLDELIAKSTLSTEHRAEIRAIRLSMVEISRRFRDEIYFSNHRSREAVRSALSEILAGLDHSIDLSYPLLSAHEEILLNEVLIEIARNTAQHSGGHSFKLSYTRNDDGIELHISDDGRGLPSPSRKNLGLVTIDQSLRFIGCNYECSSTQEGTTYRIQIPTSLIVSESSS